MKYVLAALLGLLLALPAMACPPQAAFVTGGVCVPAAVYRQRTFIVQEAPPVYQQLEVAQDLAPVQQYVLPQRQFAPMQYAPVYDPCPQASFALVYSYGVGRTFGRSFASSYGASRQQSLIGQRFLAPAPAFEKRTVTRSQTIIRRTLVP